MSNLVYRRQFPIEWGHCDPAGIVFNSRFFEFFDWSAWMLFETALGVRPSDLAATFGIVGIPLVDAKASFMQPRQVQRHGRNRLGNQQVRTLELRGDSTASRSAGELAVEGTETRVWAAADPERCRPSLKAIADPGRGASNGSGRGLDRAGNSRSRVWQAGSGRLVCSAGSGLFGARRASSAMLPSSSLGFGLQFADLLRPRRTGASRRRFRGRSWRRATPELHDRLMAARAAPDALAGKPESDLIVALAPDLEDFIGELFGIAPRWRTLRRRHDALAPLYTRQAPVRAAPRRQEISARSGGGVRRTARCAASSKR